MTKILFLLKICLLLIISCSNQTIVETPNFKITLNSSNMDEYLEISYLPNDYFRNDSILYFTYEEYHLDTIRIFREKVVKTSGIFKTNRAFNHLPGNTKLMVSRYNELATCDVLLFSRFNFSKDTNIEDDLITLMLTDNINTAKAIYSKYKDYGDYALIVNLLYMHFLMGHRPSEKINTNIIDSLVSNKISASTISEYDFWALLFLKIAGHDIEEIKSLHLNVYFRKQFTLNLSTFEYLFLRNVYSLIYNYRMNNELNPFEYHTNLFMLKVLNKNTNYILTNYILNTIIPLKQNKSLNPEIDALLSQIFKLSLQYFLELECDKFKEIYHYDLPYKFLINYLFFSDVQYIEITQLLLKFSECIKLDSWLEIGYSNGYTYEFAYGL